MSRRRTRPKVRWRLDIDEQVAAKVEVLLLDPRTGAPRYGARSAFTEQLYRAYFDGKINIDPNASQEPNNED